MKKIIAVSLLMLFGLVAKSQAALVESYISSAGFVGGGFPKSEVLLLRPNESMNYSFGGSATGTVHFEKSIDGGSNWIVIFSTTNNTLPASKTGTEYSGDKDTLYRFRASTMTAGTNGGAKFVVTLYDNDDFVGEIRNRKGVPSITITDERLFLPKMTLSPTSTTPVSMTRASTFTITDFPRSLAVVTSTGGALAMTALPTVSTATAQNGDVFMIFCATTSVITLSDTGTLVGTGLELGSTTRALGFGDVLVLFYWDRFWYEIGFYNN